MAYTVLKSKVFFSFLLLLFILVFPKTSFGLTYYEPGQDPTNPSLGSPSCYDDGGADYKDLTGDQLNDCTTYGGKVKENICFQNPWRFQYAASCRVQLGANPGDCQFVDYQYQYNNCDTSDRCYGATTGASGYDGAGRVIPGICNAAAYDGVNPNSACTSGGWYKQCCSSPGTILPETYCSSGGCPAGEITNALTTSCNALPPPPPPPPPVCPTQTCTFSTPDSACPSGYAIINGNGCSGPNCSGCNYQSCLNNGPATGGGTCTTGTPPPTPTPPPTTTSSCAVSWNTPANPSNGTNVTVTVDGLSSNFGWTNVAYNLDAGGWNSAVNVISSSIPRWQFSVPAGSSDVHTLQFSAKDSAGTTITCPPSSSFQK